MTHLIDQLRSSIRHSSPLSKDATESIANELESLHKDKELLDFAESHPDQTMEALNSWWATCGPGGRENFFAFRRIIKDLFENQQ